MTEKKHTQGKWEVQYIGQGMYNIILNGNPDDVIARVDNYNEHHEGDADAELIARAPELEAENAQLKEFNTRLLNQKAEELLELIRLRSHVNELKEALRELLLRMESLPSFNDADLEAIGQARQALKNAEKEV